MQVFEDMQAAGVRPNGYVYTALISACEEANDWRQAIRVFNKMEARPCAPVLCSLAACFDVAWSAWQCLTLCSRVSRERVLVVMLLATLGPIRVQAARRRWPRAR
jgi:pentatricopeptide repeat protein